MTRETMWKEKMKTTSTHCSTRMDGNVDNDCQRHERLQHIEVTPRGEHTVNQREWQVWWSQISAFGAVRHMPVLRQHPNPWQQLVGFTILSSTFLLTPSARFVISSLTHSRTPAPSCFNGISASRGTCICDQCRNF